MAIAITVTTIATTTCGTTGSAGRPDAATARQDSLSRVIGKARTRVPVAWKIAFASAPATPRDANLADRPPRCDRPGSRYCRVQPSDLPPPLLRGFQFRTGSAAGRRPAATSPRQSWTADGASLIWPWLRSVRSRLQARKKSRLRSGAEAAQVAVLQQVLSADSAALPVTVIEVVAAVVLAPLLRNPALPVPFVDVTAPDPDVMMVRRIPAPIPRGPHITSPSGRDHFVTRRWRRNFNIERNTRCSLARTRPSDRRHCRCYRRALLPSLHGHSM